MLKGTRSQRTPIMRTLLALTLLASLAACASKLPDPDPRMAWIDIAPDPSDTLMAHRLDGRRWGRWSLLPGDAGPP